MKKQLKYIYQNDLSCSVTNGDDNVIVTSERSMDIETTL